MKAEQISSIRERMGLGLQSQPIPDQAVISGKGLLQNRWDPRCFGARLRAAEPCLIAPCIVSIGSDDPSGIQGDSQCTRAWCCLLTLREGLKLGCGHAEKGAHAAGKLQESAAMHHWSISSVFSSEVSKPRSRAA